MDPKHFVMGEEVFLEIDIQYLGGDDFVNEDSLLVYGVLKAVVEGDLGKVKQLVQMGNSVNINDSNGNTPLHVAVIKNNMEILDYLLSRDGTDLNTQNFCGETPLLLAVKDEKVEAARRLIEAGANVNIPNHEDVTPLHLSVTHPDLAHTLVRYGAFLDAIDYSGDTPLHDATAEECLETVCMLLYYNAEANVRGVNNLTPFMKAIISKNVEIQAVLLNYVDDFNVETFDHISILALALTHKCPFVEEIIDGGADVNYAYGYDLIDAFSLCLQVPNPRNFQLIWSKLKYDGADMALGSILWRICGTLRKEYIIQYLDVIIESDNIAQVVDSITTADDLYLVIVRFSHFSQILTLDQLTKLVCQLLAYGYIITSFDMTKIFSHYGYCELFKILLHTDIKITGRRPPDTSRFIYDVNTKPKELLKQLIDIIKTEYLHNAIYQLLDYYIYPKLLSAYLDLNRGDYVTTKILNLPKIPSLLELSRNTTRDVLIEKYKVSSSCQFYTLINYLDISPTYKKILSFERVLYKMDHVENF
ncbi:uncharacterized protein LOC108911327 [Anoplophora glabripennis]|uniref:uncharacterized protein LOC108911327 n=1 Tax=Anoplophora glabripennis TaxID=217634 RepID=UPI0008750629|nr:uncharacterized protein LOC108911327 [Anoplophora glabripennis]